MSIGSAARSITIALNMNAANFNAVLHSAGGSLNQFAASGDESLKKLQQSAAVAGAAMLAGFGVAVGAAMEFEAAMSNVAAVSGATGAQFDALSDQALQLGADTQYSATQVAQAQAELLKAGVSTADVLGGALKGALDLAAAAQMDVAQASEIAAVAMNVFGLSGRDVPHVADVLAAAANKSAADVSDMGQALRQAGAQASLTGMSLEETSAALAIFANAGVKGSDAGTSFKTMLARMAAQTPDAKQAMDAIGLSFEDADGNLVDLETAAGRMSTAFGRLTTDTDRAAAMHAIFGQDASRAASILASSGAEGVAYWNMQVNDAGYAAELAAKKMDNLKGDIEKLGGSIDTVLIKAGSGSVGVLREITQATTDLVNGFGSLPDGAQSGSVALLGVAGAATTAVAGFGLMIGPIQNAKAAMAGMGGMAQFLSAQMTMRNFTGLATAAGIAIPVISLLTISMERAKTAGKEMSESFLATLPQPQTLKDYADNLAAIETQYNAIYETNRKAGEGTTFLDQGSMRVWETVNPWGEDTFTETEAALNDLRDSYDTAKQEALTYQAVMSGLTDALGMNEEQVIALADANGIDLLGAVQRVNAIMDVAGDSWLAPGMRAIEVQRILNGELVPALDAATVAAADAPPAVADLETALASAGDEALTTADRVDALNEALDTFIGMSLDGPEAARRFSEQVWAAEEAARALNEVDWQHFSGASTEEWYALEDALAGVVEQTANRVKIAQEQSASEEEVNAILKDGIDRLNGMADSGLVAAETISYYTGILEAVPEHVGTSIETPGLGEAISGLEYLRWLGENTPGMLSVGIGAAANIAAAHASGGFFNSPHVGLVGEAGPELILPLSNPGRSGALIEQYAPGLLGGGGGGGGGSSTVNNITVTLHAPGFLGDANDLQRAVTSQPVLEAIGRGIGSMDAASTGGRVR